MTTDTAALETLIAKARSGEEFSHDEIVAQMKTSDEAGWLYYSMLSGVRHQRDLKQLPDVLKRVVKGKAWQRWRWVGSEFSAPSLGAYVVEPPPNGMGATLPMVERLIEDDPEALALWRDATTGDHGGDRTSKNDNIILAPKLGTSRSYTLSRLQRDRPDLFDRVVAGELSANAAAIEAGWRVKPTPLDILVKTWRKASPAERAAFLAEIGEGA